ncbi:Oidioi.mRNA.OKI2018_I69.chr2.g5439.t1.cds [Oikopleura dioica]|uniref:Oidioi.mRNA.OKI2018_I69.chr2.g5439.t1.cds n=1 Tax=Oikopleura dioica TaxID=34765 RepID=A0ABN7T028_OIKDI|nr:Oidioi.mRNA.OKI2018_I69.chr2.g5439.t1.cds [Oikopleura dioica]
MKIKIAPAFFAAAWSKTLVIGGKSEKIEAHPSATKLLKNKNTLKCGAVLISSHSFLTAAHCLQNTNLEAITGSGSEGEEKYEISSKKQIKHPNYSSVYFTNDIAVLNVSKTISFSKFTFPAIIPNHAPVDKAPSTVCGWGSTTYPEENYPLDLQCADNYILDNANCRSYYGGDIRPGMVCAMSNTFHEDACTGDSGGPLFDWFSYDSSSSEEATEEVVGLVSWGNGCGTHPGFSFISNRYSFILRL